MPPTSNTSIFDKFAILALDVAPSSNISILNTFATLTPERGAQIGERLSSDFDGRVRSESGGVSFPFQSFPDSGAGRMPDTVHPLSGKCVEFDYDENVVSEFVNRSSCPPSVPMSGDVNRIFAVDVDRPHSAPVRWMKAMADKLDVLWSAFNRSRTMSVAGEGDGENSESCTSGMRSHQFSSAVNNERSKCPYKRRC